jgi:carbonic anhydrase
MELHQDLHGDAIVPIAIEENVWQAVEDLFMRSPAVRDLAKSGDVLVTGAIYDLASGKVNWLPQAKVGDILKRVEASPDRETEAFAN